MMKRLTAILTAVSLAICMNVMLPAAAETTEQKGMDAFDKLVAVGILAEDDGMMNHETISRGDLAKYCVNTIIKNTIEPSDEFTDVGTEEANAPYIYTAYKLGIMGGVDNKTFAPEEAATTVQALKALLGILGCGDVAIQRGGYPMGYIIAANDLKLLTGTKISDYNAPLTPENFAVMLWNAANSNVLVVKSITASGGIVTQKLSGGTALLEQYYNIYKGKGIVTADAYTSLYTNAGVREGYIKIDDAFYSLGGVDSTELLGYCVEFYYYSYKNSEKTLLLADTQKYRNDTVTVDADSILKEEVTESRFVYETADGRRETITIPKNISFVYNMKQTPVSATLLVPEKGSVQFIDNNGDGIYDLVKATHYRTVLIEGISSDYTIADKISKGTVELNPKKEYDIKIYEGAKRRTVQNLELGQVLSIAESDGEGRNVKLVRISKNSVFGMPQEITEDGIRINDVLYKADNSTLKHLYFDDTRTFYLDIFGYIVYSEKSAEAEDRVVYGYINKVGTGAFGALQMKIFTENNRWVVLDVASKITYNGVSGTPCTKFCEDYSTPEQYRMLITYRVNKDAKIVEINTAKQFEPWSEEELAAIENDTFRLSYQLVNQIYRSNLSTIGTAVRLSGDTKLFLVPDQSKEEAAESEFRIIGKGELVNEQSIMKALCYDCDKVLTAGACVMTVNDFIKATSPLLCVTDVNTGANDDGEEVYAIRGMYGKNEITVYTVAKSDIPEMTGLKKGDVIQFALNPKGYIVAYKKLVSLSEGKDQKILINGIYTTKTFVGGEVRALDYANGIGVIQYTGTSVFDLGASTIYVYDEEEEKFFVGGLYDIREGSFVFGRFNYLAGVELVVLK